MDVAESLGITLVRQGQSYTWSEHDSFVLTPKKNAFYWNSRQVGGGSIKLVQVIKECTHAEALQYLQTVEAGAVETLKRTYSDELSLLYERTYTTKCHH